MAKIFEFIGPSGIGKSTQYEVLRQHWRPDTYWAPLDYCMFSPRDRWLDYVRYRGRDEETWRRYHRDRALDDFLEHNRTLVNFFWESLSEWADYEGRDLRFNTTRFVAKIFRRHQLAEKYDESDWVVMEEGLLHNLPLVLGRSRFPCSQEEMNHLLEEVPKADVIVNFVAPPDVVARRNRKREKKTFLDRLLSYEELVDRAQRELSRNAMVAKTLAERGVETIQLDAEAPTETMSAHLLTIVNSLHTTA